MNGEQKLEAAESELADAERELDKALHDIQKAEKDIKEALKEKEQPHAFKVIVTYNGVQKPFEVRRDEPVARLLDQAKQAFGPIPNAHLLGLFNQHGAELKDDQTIAEAGVAPHDILLMRPSQVRGG
ncbi:septal ring factor EnvC (AmiA/AmiB activator) [Caulobacter ginsengisoli]|uniref:Septal ring factor EnvC (AmiA/AmiB activator) n=1 Tax=Caulobacter ginsengisoli TaxID=400775 RepID=A0ABU0IRR7_9CAUL|nr:hypothetical protein [Caulobacter ginsengisoli]MDQ0464703.1 septal ring factor EnvC (AmiA/AmiB activator) [Caulobacter ginsengisoli]